MFGLFKLIEELIIDTDGLVELAEVGSSSLCGITEVGCFTSDWLTGGRRSSTSIILPPAGIIGRLASSSLGASVSFTHI